MKVIKFNNTKESGQNVIERLEEALEMAKKGGIDNCIVIMAGTDGSIVDCWANRNQPFSMIGGIESIKKEFMDACIEGRD